MIRSCIDWQHTGSMCVSAVDVHSFHKDNAANSHQVSLESICFSEGFQGLRCWVFDSDDAQVYGCFSDCFDANLDA